MPSISRPGPWIYSVFVASLVWFPEVTQGGGLYVPDLGVAPQGRGGAYAAKADSYLALHYNPAGLFQIDGFRIEGGVMGHGMSTFFQREGGQGMWKEGALYTDLGELDPKSPAMREGFASVENLDGFRPIPEAALIYGFKNPDLTIAFGLYAPDAPWLSYDEQGASRYRATRVRLDQGNFTLGASWRPLPFLAVGGAIQFVYLSLEEDFNVFSYVPTILSSDFPDGNDEDPQYDLKVHFAARQFPALGGNFGLMLMPHDKVHIGVGFQTPIHMKAKGSIQMEGEIGEQIMGVLSRDAIGVRGEDPELLIETELPAMLRIGVLVKPHPRFELEVDGVVEFWHVNKGIFATSVDVPLFSGTEDTPLPQYMDAEGLCPFVVQADGDTGCADILEIYRGDDGNGNFTIPTGYQDTLSLRFGVEGNPVDPLILRAGYLFETNGIPDSALTLLAIDSTKHGVGAGVALKLPGFELGGSYSHVFYAERTVSLSAPKTTQTVAFEATTVPNVVDAGTYRAGVDNLGVYIRVAPGEIRKAAEKR